MKIAVCIKQVVTREWQLRVNDQKTWIRDQVGVVLAEKLGMPHATIIMEVQRLDSADALGNALRVKRELEGGWFQWVGLPLPALLTIQSGINQLRYATLKGIMAAKKKEIRKVVPA